MQSRPVNRQEPLLAARIFSYFVDFFDIFILVLSV